MWGWGGENKERKEVEGMGVEGRVEIGVGFVVGGTVVSGCEVCEEGMPDFKSRSSSSSSD